MDNRPVHDFIVEAPHLDLNLAPKLQYVSSATGRAVGPPSCGLADVKHLQNWQIILQEPVEFMAAV